MASQTQERRKVGNKLCVVNLLHSRRTRLRHVDLPLVQGQAILARQIRKLRQPVNAVRGMNEVQRVLREETTMERTRGAHHEAGQSAVIAAETRQPLEQRIEIIAEEIVQVELKFRHAAARLLAQS
ncbi:hypothetical protein MLD38_009746 [Melastoma candidum]|uniref:Uncharacterized protein n=1 Tax=Melastoma candidum TaxID=119954 RepID=A0ACB9RYJ9_9MYRT|nr:hypothetical protein MLD38_009746 [Melastoma candidum]